MCFPKLMSKSCNSAQDLGLKVSLLYFYILDLCIFGLTVVKHAVGYYHCKYFAQELGLPRTP